MFHVWGSELTPKAQLSIKDDNKVNSDDQLVIENSDTSYKSVDSFSNQNRGIIRSVHKGFLTTLLNQTNSRVPPTKLRDKNIRKRKFCCDPKRETKNSSKPRRERNVFVTVETENETPPKVVKEKPSASWVFSEEIMGQEVETISDQGLQRAKRPRQSTDSQSQAGAEREWTEPSSSTLVRFNRAFFWFGEPTLLAIGVLGNTLLVAVFLITPLRLRAVSHTMAATGICDLLYTAGCLLMHVSSKGVGVLALPGACQLITFTLVLSQVIATWCLFISHLSRLNAHTKTGYEGRKRRVCKTKFTVITLALLIAAVSVHYLWSMDKVTIAGRVYCAPMREVVNAHIILRKLELVVGILLPLILMAGIDLLLVVKVVVHMVVMRWDQEEEDDDVGYLASSTFGAHKIVKMPLCPRFQENDQTPTSGNNSAIALQEDVDMYQNSESSTGPCTKTPCVPLEHTVVIEMGQEIDLDVSANDQDKMVSNATNSGFQPENNNVVRASDGCDLYTKETAQLGKCVEAVCPSRKTFLQNTEKCKLIDKAQLKSMRETNLVTILEKPLCQEEASALVDCNHIKKTIRDMPTHKDRKVSTTSITTVCDSSLPAQPSMTVPHKEAVGKSAPSRADEQGCLSLSNSSHTKRHLSSLKAVFSSFTALKSKTLQVKKKVGFLGEVSGDRTQSDYDRRKRRRVGLFSFSESGAGSKSSNTKYQSSYASYKTIDSTTGSIHNQPADHDFPQDHTSCTITTVLTGLILAALILPATCRHAVRMFGSSVSSPPSLKEIEVLFNDLLVGLKVLSSRHLFKQANCGGSKPYWSEAVRLGAGGS
ncbi:hypothetical protein EGW08_007041 [Elysia chlorotica]|uniref:G-protein coupled receptors family 1 profile domain-containing protein n=1 Tax=Elysia chlorotica TaxID=188477 RepID=A0A3S1C7N6_ELYCH|nr:hypothetical protein EGW08_007041 [Elysia chlorotica]